MNLKQPLHVITPTLDADILALLARADRSYTGREVERKMGRAASHRGVSLALERLVSEGIVDVETAGRAKMFRLNRDHLAAPWIEKLAQLRLELIERLRTEIAGWDIQPAAAVLFGSAARDEATEQSDLDLLFIRPRRIDSENDAWQEQVASLAASASRWTGNDARVLEYSEQELPQLAGREPVLAAAADEGVDIASANFRRLWKKLSS